MSARGRHRRYKPNRISRASLTLTAGGAGIALPLIGAGGAHAASVDTWDKVAECESSGDWTINTGNGFYGGLQFTQSTWQEFGGGEHATRADLASKDQQITTAEKVLEVQGPGAWPVCGPKAGLTRGGGAPDISPDAPQVSAPAKAKAKAAPKAERKPAAGSGKHRKPDSYTVASGDTLYKIAHDHDVEGGWEAVYDDNREVVGQNPNLIRPGLELSLHGDAAPAPERQAPKHATAAPKHSPAPEKKAQQSSSGFTAPVHSAIGTPYHKSGSAWSSGYHTGVDFPVSSGTAVKAVGAGEVVSAGWGGAYGNQVVIRHPDGKYSQYAHLSNMTVRSGQSVSGGQQIGYSGSTGNAFGPHLHFEIRTGPGYGSDVDPLAYLRAHGVTI